MPELDPRKLHVTLSHDLTLSEGLLPRRYTLTHSDLTGDLFLTIGRDYNRRQISGLYTRLMRDEVLAEWQKNQEPTYQLKIYCHLSGGLVIGSARWRYGIFKHHMPQVIQAFRYGDGELYSRHPDLDQAAVLVEFQSRKRRHRRNESWGRMADYRI